MTIIFVSVNFDWIDFCLIFLLCDFCNIYMTIVWGLSFLYQHKLRLYTMQTFMAALYHLFLSSVHIYQI